MKYIFVFVLFISSCFAGDIDLSKGTHEDKIKLKSYISSKIPDINKFNDYHKVIEIRNYVYHHVKLARGGTFSNKYVKIVSILDGKEGLLCGGISAVYASLVSLYDIPVNYVQLISTDCENYNLCNDSHVAVEVKIDNKWQAQDPTFNIEWEADFNNLKYLFNMGREPLPNSNNFTMIKGRTIEEYYLPYRNLLGIINIHHVDLWPNKQ
jgi:hypothetical protein